MKIYKTQQEIAADIKDGVLAIDGDVKFECSFAIEASIVVKGYITANNITACDINACDINACDIAANNITARYIAANNITARDINANNITARNFTAFGINARNITAFDINANNIIAANISYYGFCNVYNSIKCESIKSRRTIHSKPVCLDGKLTITPKASAKEMTLAEVSKELGYEVKIVK